MNKRKANKQKDVRKLHNGNLKMEKVVNEDKRRKIKPENIHNAQKSICKMYDLYKNTVVIKNKWSKLQSFRRNANRYGIGYFV